MIFFRRPRRHLLVVFTVAATVLDSVLRPLLIRRGANLPMLLILAGVIGGLIVMGLLGIFIGPTVLAIAYTLLNAWMEQPDKPSPSNAAL